MRGPRRPWWPLVVVTLNVHHGDTTGERWDLHRLAGEADVMLLQEVGGRDLDRLLPHGWSYRTGRGVAVCWRTSLGELLADGVWTLAEAQWVGPGAGPDRMPVKEMPWIRLRVGGAVVSFGCLHLVASQHRRRRRRVARAMIRRAAVWAAAQPGAVVVGGDWNARPTVPRLAPLRRLGLVTSQNILDRLATFGRRSIDAVWSDLAPAAHHAHRNGSDHRALVTILAIPV